jgi:hypothetical protein
VNIVKKDNLKINIPHRRPDSFRTNVEDVATNRNFDINEEENYEDSNRIENHKRPEEINV